MVRAVLFKLHSGGLCRVGGVSEGLHFLLLAVNHYFTLRRRVFKRRQETSPTTLSGCETGTLASDALRCAAGLRPARLRS